VPLTNASDIVPSAFPCCDNCIQGKRATHDAILTEAETKVLLLIDHIQAGPLPISDASQEAINVDALDTVTGNISSMCQRGERLKVCREALVEW